MNVSDHKLALMMFMYQLCFSQGRDTRALGVVLGAKYTASGTLDILKSHLAANTDFMKAGVGALLKIFEFLKMSCPHAPEFVSHTHWIWLFNAVKEEVGIVFEEDWELMVNIEEARPADGDENFKMRENDAGYAYLHLYRTQAKNYILGGFRTAPTNMEHAFVFTITNPSGHPPLKLCGSKAYFEGGKFICWGSGSTAREDLYYVSGSQSSVASNLREYGQDLSPRPKPLLFLGSGEAYGGHRFEHKTDRVVMYRIKLEKGH